VPEHWPTSFLLIFVFVPFFCPLVLLFSIQFVSNEERELSSVRACYRLFALAHHANSFRRISQRPISRIVLNALQPASITISVISFIFCRSFNDSNECVLELYYHLTVMRFCKIKYKNSIAYMFTVSTTLDLSYLSSVAIHATISYATAIVFPFLFPPFL